MEIGCSLPTSSSSSSSPATHTFSRSLLHSLDLRGNSLRCFVPSNVFAPWKKLPSHGRDRGCLVVAAAKKKKKTDSHSFVPKPDEATGPFPEAVLLKKKTVTEDGRVQPEFADAEEEELYEFLSLQLESDLDVERMRHYEVVYLIHEDCVDEVESVVTKVQEFIREKKGRIWRLNNWGLRRLAYKIKKAKNANYILMNFEVEAKWINDFKTMLDKDERIIRHLVMKRDEAITEDCPPPPEFHTLRQQGMDDDDEDEDEDEDEDDVDTDELQLETDDYEGDDSGENIFLVDVDKDDEEGSTSGRPRRLKAEKVIM